MGENPSRFQGDEHPPAEGELQEKRPVERVSFEDAIYFCNKLSTMFGLVPVYSVDGIADVTKWDYEPHHGESLYGRRIEQNLNANGYRLPTVEEWQYAARGGKYFKYAGSNNIDEVAWYEENSNDKTHEVGKKKANGYGLFDMSGNVEEWCWDFYNNVLRYHCGGSYYESADNSAIFHKIQRVYSKSWSVGFRIVCSLE